MNKNNDVIKLLVDLLQGQQAKDLCRLLKIDVVKSVKLNRTLNDDGSFHYELKLSLISKDSKITSFQIVLQEDDFAKIPRQHTRMATTTKHKLLRPEHTVADRGRFQTKQWPEYHVTCKGCGFGDVFVPGEAASREEAVKLLHDQGWRSRKNEWTCPKCSGTVAK